MAVRTSTQAGNTNSAPFAFGSAVNAGDQLVCNHAVTVDASVTLGISPPTSQLTSTYAVSLSSVAGGGSLPAATYRAQYTNVDAGGVESGPSWEGGSLALSSGNTLRITLPSLPAGVASRNIYLTGSGSGTEKLYATGVSGTTFDCTSASWNNGTQAYAAAANPPPQGAIVVNSGAGLTIGSGITLKVRGDLVNGNGTVTIRDDSILEFDASAAATPASTTYVFYLNNNDGQANSTFQSANTSAAHPFTVRSNSGGANAQCLNFGRDVGIWNVQYGTFLRIGSASYDGFSILYGVRTGVIQTFTGITFDTCGRVNQSSSCPTSSGWAYSKCVWTNTQGSTPIALSGNDNPTASRSMDQCVFDKIPSLSLAGASVTNSVFLAGIAHDGGNAQAWATFDSNFVNIPAISGACPSGGDLTNNFFLFGTSNAAAVTGAATAGGASTLTDSTKAWTSNQFEADQSSNGWYVVITGGTGKGQSRSIVTNTATVLNTLEPWDTVPDATSTYAIVDGLANPHVTNCSGMLGTSPTMHITGNVWQNADADNNGDCLSQLTGSGVTYSVKQNIILPSDARDNSGTLFSLDSSAQTTIVEHNTIFTGSQTALISDGGSTPAGKITSFRSNIFWCDPSKTNTYAGAGSGTVSPSALGPYKLANSAHSANPALDPADVVTAGMADYNTGYGCKTGYAGKGYNVNCSVTPGAHDVDADPQFVDRWRNFESWAVSQGSASASPIQQRADGISYLKANPSLIASSLIPYIRAGFAPTNAALHNAAHDGTDIGAVAYQAAVTGGPFPHFLRRSMHGGMTAMAGGMN